MCDNRMNCNIFRAMKRGYLKEVIGYCNAFGWKYLLYDSFKIGKRC